MESGETYSIVILPIPRDGSQQIHGMVSNPILRDHASPVCHICIISDCEDASVGNFGRQQSLRPWSGRILCLPRLLAVSGKAVDENNTRIWNVAS
jgi:hypothetical protein